MTTFFFEQCRTSSYPPPLLLPLGWNSSRITARALFIPILCLLRHLAIAPPPTPPSSLPSPCSPLQSLINRSWYWWELNAGKWLPVKPLHAPASHPACDHIQAWLACQPLTMPCESVPLCLSWLNPSLCLSVCLFIYHSSSPPPLQFPCLHSFFWGFQDLPWQHYCFTFVPVLSVPLCHLLMPFYQAALLDPIKEDFQSEKTWVRTHILSLALYTQLAFKTPFKK